MLSQQLIVSSMNLELGEKYCIQNYLNPFTLKWNGYDYVFVNEEGYSFVITNLTLEQIQNIKPYNTKKLVQDIKCNNIECVCCPLYLYCKNEDEMSDKTIGDRYTEIFKALADELSKKYIKGKVYENTF